MQNSNQKRGDLGQHWTPSSTVKLMLTLISGLPDNGSILEPAVGTGNIYTELIKQYDSDYIDALEIDENVVPEEYKEKFEIDSFFNMSPDRKYNCIIGNPPYVNGRLLDTTTRSNIKKYNSLIPMTSNLYLHFIEKCVKHHMIEGSQIIFIVPNTFLSKVSFGKNLRKYLLKHGNITHHIKHNAKWDKASIETVIFRWVKGEKQNGHIINEHNVKADIFHKDGSIFFIDYKTIGTLSDWFKISVGCVPRKINLSDIGISLIKNNKIEVFSKKHMWSREIYSKPCHKILFKSGPTRSREIFYNTLDHSEEQASKHIDFAMTFKYDMSADQLKEVSEALNEFFNEKDNILGLRPDGRWTAGITEMKNIPINQTLNNIFTTIKNKAV